MRRYATAAVLFAMATSAGCSSSQDDPARTTPAQTTASIAEPSPLPAEPTEPNTAGVSADGVTTAVDVPSEATESQYGQACRAAKIWMDAQTDDATTLVEPYLKILQAPDFRDPGNFDTPWAELTPAQQAGVIMAVNAAAAGDCA